MTRRQLVIVLSGFPRRSETFALHDIAALDERGMVAAVFSTKPGEDGEVQPGATRLRRRVQLLSGDAASQAADAARLIGDTPVAGVHAYFAHAPAAVGADLARRLRVPFGFSVHARDARKVPRPVLHDRARQAACVVACNTDVAREFDGSGARVQLVPHGVDLRRFSPGRGSDGSVFRLLAVGRLVEKKGFDVLLGAMSSLPGRWRLRIVGEGPELGRLTALTHALGLADRVTFCGAMTHDELPAEYTDADAVVIPSVRDRSGDRDGLPNVVLEAMASGAAIVATEMGAIPSAIRDGATGILVPAGDGEALAAALARLARDPALRSSLGAAARATVERHFDARHCTERLVSVLDEAYA